MRPFLLLGLALLPASAGERRECGIVPGERYWILSDGLLFPDGTILPDWHGCQLAAGVTLALAYDEDPPIPNYVIETHAACKPAPSEAEQIAALVAKVREALKEKTPYADEVPVVEKPCTERRRVDARIVP